MVTLLKELMAAIRLWFQRFYLCPLSDAVPDPFLHVPRRNRRMQLQRHITARKMTLILDLDETLVHSSIKPLANYDWRVYVPAAGNQRGHTFFVAVRPHTGMFLRAVAKCFEVVVFTASLQHYADPVIDLIDVEKCVSRRFFRSACKVWQGNFLKDITCVRKDLSQVIIVDNSPTAYCLQEDNGMAIPTWIDDPTDDSLATLLPVLQGLVLLNDVRSILGLRSSKRAGGLRPPPAESLPLASSTTISPANCSSDPGVSRDVLASLAAGIATCARS